MKSALLVCFILLFTNCSDDAQVYIQDKKHLKTELTNEEFIQGLERIQKDLNFKN